jgi:hypothetical protein
MFALLGYFYCFDFSFVHICFLNLGGSKYTCAKFYSREEKCTEKHSNFGLSSVQACCTCGGGEMGVSMDDSGASTVILTLYY